MKYAEVSALSAKEIVERIQGETVNLTRLKFAHAISPIENPTQIRNARRLIAKLKTAQNQSLKS